MFHTGPAAGGTTSGTTTVVPTGRREVGPAQRGGFVAERERLVHIVDEVPELDAVREAGDELALVLVLDGFLDAGNAAARAAQHLVDLSDGPVVATFDAAQLHDYRARRPPISFVRDHH